MKNLFLYLILLLPFLSFGQNIEVRLDTNSILLGEQTVLHLAISYRVDTGKETMLQFPTFSDTLVEKIEIFKKSKVDTSILDNNDPYLFTQSQKLTITSFDIGTYELPSFFFILNNDTIYSPKIAFEVRDIILEEKAVLAEIKAPIEDPLTVWEWLKEHWLWFLIPLVTVLVLVLIVYFFLTRGRKVRVEKPKPIIPAHIIARKELENIQTNELWQKGKFKQYHSEISVTIRQYLENRYQINALEQTSDEIFTALRFKSITEINKEKLHHLLCLADLVKFAKEIPIGSENEESMKSAFSFVEETKLIEEEIKDA